MYGVYEGPLKVSEAHFKDTTKQFDFSDLEKLLNLEPGDLDYNFNSGQEMSVKYALPYGKIFEGDFKTTHIVKVAGYMASNIISQLGMPRCETHNISKIKGGYKGLVEAGSIITVSVRLKRTLGKKNGKMPHIFLCTIKSESKEVFVALFQLDCWTNNSSELLRDINRKNMKRLALS